MDKVTLLQRENTQLKGMQSETISLLKQVSTQVGTHYGEMIAEHIATLQGQRHNPKDWDLADRNGEQ